MFKKTLLASALFALFSQSALAADKVRWLNDWLPAGDKAAIYLGVEQGLFAAEGIEVEIASARGGSDVVTKLATNSADFGSAGLASLLQAKAQGEVPVVAVAPIYNKQPDAFFTTEGSGIESFKDIVGKTVATPTFSASNVVWPLLLERNGIDPNSVKLLKLDPGALAPMLATGKVDATINWLTVALLLPLELTTGFPNHFRHNVLVMHCLPVGPIVGHRVPRAYNSNNPRSQRNLLSLEAEISGETEVIHASVNRLHVDTHQHVSLKPPFPAGIHPETNSFSQRRGQ